MIDCFGVTPTKTITVKLPDFAPDLTTLSKKGILLFINADNTPHTVTSGNGGASPSADGKWDATLAPGAVACVQFHQKGTYSYYCKNYAAQMQAAVIVH